jgi:hypothetical protein
MAAKHKCLAAKDLKLGPLGLEPKIISSCNHKQLEKVSKTGVAESGAVGPSSIPLAPDLAQVIDAWPNLSESIRKAIVTLVRG